MYDEPTLQDLLTESEELEEIVLTKLSQFRNKTTFAQGGKSITGKYNYYNVSTNRDLWLILGKLLEIVGTHQMILEELIKDE